MSFSTGDSAAAPGRKTLSVVLPFYNALQCLDITLRSLQQQTLDPALWEIVVVDDGSGLPVGPLLDGIDGDVDIRLVTAERNLGRSGARNLGVSHAEGDIILFHDPDAFIAPDSVQRHYDFHRRSPGSVLMGARYDSTWKTLNRLLRGDFSRTGKRQGLEAVLHAEADSRETLPFEDVSQTRSPWFWVIAHSLSMPKSMYVDVGGFDENFRGWGPEDSELGYRIWEHVGRRPEVFAYDPDAVVYHIPHYSDPSKNFATMRRNTEYFLQKHQRFDIEIWYYSEDAVAVLKIPMYEELIDYFLVRGLGTVTAGIRDLADRNAPALVVGSWPGDAEGPSEQTLCYDHSRPPSDRNKHLLGMTTLLEDGALQAVINVDFWRLLLLEDLNRLVAESLRIAPELILVQTPGADELDGPMESCSNLGFVAEMLAHPHSVTRETVDGADVLRVTARRPAGG
jgi:glycosyltransferase involved in cell wall biosynthesis